MQNFLPDPGFNDFSWRRFRDNWTEGAGVIMPRIDIIAYVYIYIYTVFRTTKTRQKRKLRSNPFYRKIDDRETEV